MGFGTAYRYKLHRDGEVSRGASDLSRSSKSFNIVPIDSRASVPFATYCRSCDTVELALTDANRTFH